MELVTVALVIFAVSFALPIYLLFQLKKIKLQIAALEQGAPVVVQDVAEEVQQSWAPPEVVATLEVPPEVQEDAPPKFFVFKPELRANVVKWLQKNWFFATAAVSMALAGVFLVQYGVENGLLSPTLRVIAAIALGVILIGVGEYIRRKTSGDEQGSFALLPSAFAGAGLVSMFAGVLSARMMYGLIGPELAFFGLGLTGTVAVVLGWFYGPLLAIVGVFGALTAPFLVGGESEVSHFLHLYFAGIVAVALAIDSVKRWAWLSVLGLIGGYIASGMLYFFGDHEAYFIGFALISAALATSIPMRSLNPGHSGKCVSGISFGARGEDISYPEFPTRVASGAFVASSAFVGLVYLAVPSGFWMVLGSLFILFAAALIWMRGADALRDMAYIPAAFGLGIITLEAVLLGAVHQGWLKDAMRPELDFASSVMATLLLGGLLTSLGFAWRSARNGGFARTDAGVAAVFAPLIAAIAEVAWAPSDVLGSGNWALYLAVIAIAMIVLAERFARKDGDDRLRTAMFALSAISMLSFVLVVLLGEVALTLALAVMVAAAAWLGAQLNLPLFDRYVQVVAVIVSVRLVVYPGLEWAFEASAFGVVLAYGGTIALLTVANYWKRKDAVLGVSVVLESVTWSLGGVLATVLLIRYYNALDANSKFVQLALIGLIWLISSANQLYRLRIGGALRRARIVLASIYGVAGLLFLGVATFPLNPLIESTSRVAGPYILDSLAASYLLPALLFAGVARRFAYLPILLRKAMASAATLLGALYIGLEIRRWWQGDSLSGNGVLDGELYSYTVAMMTAAIVLLVLAFVRQSPLLRKLALVAVGLTVAKVYLIDMSGLDGLLRVVSFLVLGLVLAAMAWVNGILQKNEGA